MTGSNQQKINTPNLDQMDRPNRDTNMCSENNWVGAISGGLEEHYDSEFVLTVQPALIITWHFSLQTTTV